MDAGAGKMVVFRRICLVHDPPTFVESLAEQLNKKTTIEVKVAEDNEPILPGKIYIAPGSLHLEIMKRSGIFYTQVKEGKPIGFHIPAVNVLFLSAARIGGPQILGIILIGMGEDGARGILQMKLNSCRTIGQDGESSIVYGMPKRAFEMGGLERQVSLSSISEKIVEFGEGRLK
jgi:two-component system chemotaxis response regulator CheB